MVIALKDDYTLVSVGNGKGFYIPTWEIKALDLDKYKKFKIILQPIEGDKEE
jgi:hypothetical protein